jgi:hypothetical protein
LNIKEEADTAICEASSAENFLKSVEIWLLVKVCDLMLAISLVSPLVSD